MQRRKQAWPPVFTFPWQRIIKTQFPRIPKMRGTGLSIQIFKLFRKKSDFRVLIQRKFVPLHIESVRGRACTALAIVFLRTQIFLLLNLSAELAPRTRHYERNQISVGAAHYSAVSTIGYLGQCKARLRVWTEPALSLCPY